MFEIESLVSFQFNFVVRWSLDIECLESVLKNEFPNLSIKIACVLEDDFMNEKPQYYEFTTPSDDDFKINTEIEDWINQSYCFEDIEDNLIITKTHKEFLNLLHHTYVDYFTDCIYIDHNGLFNDDIFMEFLNHKNDRSTFYTIDKHTKKYKFYFQKCRYVFDFKEINLNGRKIQSFFKGIKQTQKDIFINREEEDD